MDAHETTATPVRRRLDRRTVLKGAAWSVPAVVAVGATPAFAATLLAPTPTKLEVQRDGNSKYWFYRLTANNPNTSTQITGLAFSATQGGWAGEPALQTPSPATTLDGLASTTAIWRAKRQNAAAANDTRSFVITVSYNTNLSFTVDVQAGTTGTTPENYTLNQVGSNWTASDPTPTTASTNPTNAQQEAESSSVADTIQTEGDAEAAIDDPAPSGTSEGSAVEPSDEASVGTLPSVPEIDPPTVD